jgi:transposase
MNKSTHYIGIDISKSTFQAHGEKGLGTFQNDRNGFKKLKKQLAGKEHIVVEATGCYHHGLAMFFFEHGFRVSVVNPLVVKRYIQMKLRRTKTDKSDAMMIARFAADQHPDPWQPEPEYIRMCKEINAVLELYLKQSTAQKNKIHGLKAKGIVTGALITSVKRQLRNTRKEIEKLQQELSKLIYEHQPELMANLQSIPGIGRKTAILLIAATNAFESFESHKQLTAYFGLAPAERTSGSSIRGRTRITKAGHPVIRNHLFLCSFTASKANPQCHALYERITAKGKSKKLALIAVCNKLIKQAFAIAKSQMPYDPAYVSRKPKTIEA